MSLYGSIIVTYRCNSRCNMCRGHTRQSEGEEELDPGTLEKLPAMDFANITGGEPFLRKDIGDIVSLVKAKARRVVISSNGYYHEAILDLFHRHPDIGIRISLEGLPAANDAIRGVKDGFDRGLRLLVRLREMGIRDIGFGITLQDRNAGDLLDLYHLARQLKMEFATAALHNSFYFNRLDNKIENKDLVRRELERLVTELLASGSPKKWLRAYFNHGLIHYMQGGERLLPCRMGTSGFFLDPKGNVLPCNGSPQPLMMGNLREQGWTELWNSPRAEEIRERVKNCGRNCWMIGSAAPAIREHPVSALLWVLRHKFKEKYRYYPERSGVNKDRDPA